MGKINILNGEKYETFAKDLYDIFEPYPATDTNTDNETYKFLDTQQQQNGCVQPVTPREVQRINKTEVNHTKAPGYDLLTGQIMKELPWKE